MSVDRLDYSKGLVERFRAFEQLLEHSPQQRNNVSLVQIAPPTRSDVDTYRDIRPQLEDEAGRINGRYAELDWTPIRYLNRQYERSVLMSLFRESQVGFVTPLRDGMNLVAKEYVAAQDPDDPGVLVLSQFAGAARELNGALIVNPLDIDGMADALAPRSRCRSTSGRRGIGRCSIRCGRTTSPCGGTTSCGICGTECCKARDLRRPRFEVMQAAASAPATAGSLPCCFDSSSRYKPGRSRNSCGEPSSMTLPELITMIRSKFCSVDRRCAIATTVRPTISRSSACWIASSDELSSADVASSSSRIGAFFRIARAIAIRWRCPPESFTPRSPTIVSNPSGIASMKSVQRASRAAASTSSRLASGRPYAMFSYTVRWNSEMSCGTSAIDWRRLSCVIDRISCPSTRIAAALRLVEALQQREHGRFARARLADQPDALSRLDVQVEVVENRPAARIRERHALEIDAPALRHEFGRVRAVRHAVRLEQRLHGFGKTRDVLRHIDERHRQVARAVQDRETERADEHDVAGSSATIATTATAPSRAARPTGSPSRPRGRAAAFPDTAGSAGARPSRP